MSARGSRRRWAIVLAAVVVAAWLPYLCIWISATAGAGRDLWDVTVTLANGSTQRHRLDGRKGEQELAADVGRLLDRFPAAPTAPPKPAGVIRISRSVKTGTWTIEVNLSYDRFGNLCEVMQGERDTVLNPTASGSNPDLCKGVVALALARNLRMAERQQSGARPD